MRIPRASRQREEVPRDEPGEDEMGAHDALVNWAAWCMVRRTPGRAGSAEGNYRPEAGNVFHGLEPSKRINIPQAEEVNAAMVTVPEAQRMALHMRYYLRMPDRGIAGAVGIAPSSYLRFMADARRLLWAAFLSRADKAIIARDNLRGPIANDDVEPLGRGEFSSSPA